MIAISNGVLQRGTQVLLDDANLMIHSGQKVGIIGRNGSGKTSLFACLKGDLALDQGDLSIPEGLRISFMRQETDGSARCALDFVVDGDSQFRSLEQQLAQAEEDDDRNRIAQLHGELDNLEGYTVVNRAEQLLSGLGFSPDEFKQPVASFSGGWRVRLNLAAALMCPSDLLLLDEPTNHLDLEATLWLEQWLIQYQGTLLIISHDREFLDKIIRVVINFENRQLQSYKGNYSEFEKLRGARLALERAMYDKQQRRKAEIEDFVRRFRAKASKAKQAQSRLKEMQRMQDIVLAHTDSPFRLHFPEPEHLPDYLFNLKKLSIGFTSALVKNIDFSIQSSTRVGLLGFNGSGKSTLLKVLAGELKPLEGEISSARQLKVGYFDQHQVDVLDKQSTPLKILQGKNPGKSEQQLKDYLGGFDFRGDRAEASIAEFSGGEKVRLALAMIAWQQPNLLLLDEPTNHLDLEMRHALTVALQEYPGALVIVSHDRHLLNNTVDSFYLIHDGQLTQFDGDLHDYQQWILSTSPKNSALPEESESLDSYKNSGSSSSESQAPKGDKKAQRKLAATRREQQAPQRKKLVKLEKEMEVLNSELTRINQLLEEPELYQEENKAELNKTLGEHRNKKAKLQLIEEQWLELQDEIDTTNTYSEAP